MSIEKTCKRLKFLTRNFRRFHSHCLRKLGTWSVESSEVKEDLVERRVRGQVKVFTDELDKLVRVLTLRRNLKEETHLRPGANFTSLKMRVKFHLVKFLITFS